MHGISLNESIKQGYGTALMQPGDYRGDVLIRSPMALVGQGRKKTIIRGSVILSAPCTLQNLTIIGCLRIAHKDPQGTVIRGCRLRAPLMSGGAALTDVLRLEDGATVDADCCIIDGLRWEKGRARCCVRLEGSSICSLRRCTLTRSSCAVSLSSSAHSSVFVAHDCLFFGNCFSLSAKAGQVLISQCNSTSLVKDWDYKDADVDVIDSISAQAMTPCRTDFPTLPDRPDEPSTDVLYRLTTT